MFHSAQLVSGTGRRNQASIDRFKIFNDAVTHPRRNSFFPIGVRV